MIDFKFRAWNNDTKQMRDVFNLILSNDMDDEQNIYIVEVGIGEDDKMIKWNRDEDDFIVMQYTGLKDKNGKEIYEGDIVKTFDKGSIASVEVGEVYMSKYGFWAIKECGYKDEDLDDDQIEVEISSYTFVGDGTDKRKNCGFEVVGNIYENPELLVDNARAII